MSQSFSPISHDDFAATAGTPMWPAPTTDPAEVMLTRRKLLRTAGLLGIGGLVTAIGADRALAAKKTTKKVTTTRATKATSASTSATTAGTSATTTPASACTVIPSETGGPYPGDGSNGVNVLTQNGIVRSDIRSSFGNSTTTAKGVPITLRFSLRSSAKGCAALTGAAFYAWHCDKDGSYSLYSPAVTNENYLRGVQISDGDGVVEFQTIFPGAYLGRWPHVHFEIYPSAAQASTSRNALHTSQLSLPEATCNLVYATAGYETSKTNFPQTPIARDNVFFDGWTLQTSTVTGDVIKGFVSNLTVTI